MQIKTWLMAFLLVLIPIHASASCLLALSTSYDAFSELARLRILLDQSDPSEIVFGLLAEAYPPKEEGVFQALERQFKISKQDFQELLRAEVGRLQGEADVAALQESQQKNLQNELTQRFLIDGTNGVFHRIEPAAFKMGYKKVDVLLTKPFEMMATLTTQVIWRKVAELANSRFGDRYNIKLKPSHFEGDTRPVENVSHEDIQLWIQALNDLSEAGEPSLIALFPEHKAGDTYRLPTDAEWEFVIRGRGQQTGRYHFGDDESELEKYAWFRRHNHPDTPQSSQPVAMKEPLLIDGTKAFYDLHGNVREFVSDWADDYDHSALPGGVDPQGPETGKYRVLRGGSWYDDAKFAGSPTRVSVDPKDRCKFRGFRLVKNIE